MYCPSSKAVVAQTKMLGDLVSSESPLSQFVNNGLSLCPSMVRRAGGLFPASFTRTPVSVTFQRPHLLIASPGEKDLHMNLEDALRPWRSLDVECLFVLLCVSVLCIESGCLHSVSTCLPEAMKCTSL